MEPLESLKDKVVVITGSARGAGLGQARAFAKEGAKVVVADRTDKPRPDLMMPDTIHTVADEINREGGTAIPFKLDLRQEEQIEALKNKVLETFGTVDVIVNNAAITFNARA